MPTISEYRRLNRKHKAPNSREPYALIEGDSMIVLCRSPGKWRLTHISRQHKGSYVSAKQNAVAILLTAYTSTA